MSKINIRDYINIDETFDLSGKMFLIQTSDENEEASKVYVAKKKELAEKHGMRVVIRHDKPMYYNSDETPEIEMVQKPTSSSLERRSTFVPEYCDIDGLGDAAAVKMYRARRPHELPKYVPCTAYGVHKFIEAHNTLEPVKTRVAILGRSELVGKPLDVILRCHGYRVETFDSRSDIRSTNDLYDYIVVATGVLFDYEHTTDIAALLRNSGCIVDVGIHRINGKLRGDMHPLALENATVNYTPVPGGVGLLTTWSIFKQLNDTLKREQK